MANPKHRHALRATKGNVTFRQLSDGSLRCNQTGAVLPNGQQTVYRRRILNGMRADVEIYGNNFTLRKSTLPAKQSVPKTVMVKTDTTEDGTTRHRFTCRHCNRVNLLKPRAANRIQRSRVRSAKCQFCGTYNPLSFRTIRPARPQKRAIHSQLSKRPRPYARVVKNDGRDPSEHLFCCFVCGTENPLEPPAVKTLALKKHPKRPCVKCQRVNKLEFGQRRRKRRAYGQT